MVKFYLTWRMIIFCCLNFGSIWRERNDNLQVCPSVQWKKRDRASAVAVTWRGTWTARNPRRTRTPLPRTPQSLRCQKRCRVQPDTDTLYTNAHIPSSEIVAKRASHLKTSRHMRNRNQKYSECDLSEKVSDSCNAAARIVMLPATLPKYWENNMKSYRGKKSLTSMNNY